MGDQTLALHLLEIKADCAVAQIKTGSLNLPGDRGAADWVAIIAENAQNGNLLFLVNLGNRRNPFLTKSS